jgi:hypothetical protein
LTYPLRIDKIKSACYFLRRFFCSPGIVLNTIRTFAQWPIIN